MCCEDFHKGQGQDSLELINTSYGDFGWCVCVGDSYAGCCGYATKDDGLCDRCRKHCRSVPRDQELPPVGDPYPMEERHVEVASVS